MNLRGAFAALLCVATYGCGGSAYASSGDAPACYPAQPEMAMVYPVAGATAVPDAPRSIVVAFGAQFGTWRLDLVRGGSTTAGGVLGSAPSPIPTPSATPPFSNPIYYGVTVPQLHANTTYSVRLTDTTLQCLQPSTIGSFTTR